MDDNSPPAVHSNNDDDDDVNHTSNDTFFALLCPESQFRCKTKETFDPKYSTDDPWFNELQGNKVLSTMILSTMNDNALEMVKCMNMDFDNPILWNIFCHSLGQAFVT